jgi:hypothetical protein
MTAQEAIAKSDCMMAERVDGRGYSWLYDAEDHIVMEQAPGFDENGTPNFVLRDEAFVETVDDWEPSYQRRP